MRVLLLSFLAVIVSTEDSFEEKLREGHQLLKNDRNADDTMEFLQKLHTMEKEIKAEYSKKPTAEELKAMEDYAKIKKSSMGVSIAGVNRDSKVGNALFQGDMILTKQQADEILEDIKESKGNRNKRQAYRDEKYPGTLWSQGINYVFWNATNSARRVFQKAAVIWRENTCLEFREDNSATDKVYVIHGNGCWSHVGRIGGSQILSLGNRLCKEKRFELISWNPYFIQIGLGLHELGHTIGLFHTQSRHDRDDFITLHFENLINGWEDQFAKESERTNYNYNITYDYGTVMHYGATACEILVKLGLCDSSAYTAELKEQVCPRSCR
uniref:Metalloendopeptidase n=1 Tax=Angiostrongylus cantonensis TaxID=6313 RepID=A0A0K0DKG3_ANGCA